MAIRGMVVAPHHLAAEAGVSILRDGGNAIEAMIAAAATVAVVYPHMNGIGGDGFWLIGKPGLPPTGIAACGKTGQRVTTDLYRQAGYPTIPGRGALAANTVAGTLSGWDAAFALSKREGGTLPLEHLLMHAIHYAENGFPLTASQAQLSRAKLPDLRDVPGFADAFLVSGQPPDRGFLFRQPRLANTLRSLAREGIDGFYRGELARRVAADLERVGSPLVLDDLQAHRAETVAPLAVTLDCGTVFNLPPPTQGLASLMILGIFDRMNITEVDGFDHVHAIVEATKRAFLVRDREVTDPAFMRRDPASVLATGTLASLAEQIDREKALPWPVSEAPADTIWMGTVDARGLVVSFIQSIYWEFGSGIVLPDTGILWQNRGSSFELREHCLNSLRPRRLPFHTLNPALAYLHDGRIMAYGTMGGDGQPQTQAAIFTRYIHFGQGLQEALSAPRWLLGRTWGDPSTTLKLEDGFTPAVATKLAEAGHIVEILPRFHDTFGHAGAAVRHSTGVLEGAGDPRSDGCAAGF